MNLPNKLTIGRIVAVPFFIACFMMKMYIAALVIFCLASLTDLLDGKIARARGLVTNFGKIMDPLADKILVYSALCLFIDDRIISGWMLIIILAREFVVSGMRTIAASEGTVLAAGMSGKVKTVFQMFAVILIIAGLAITSVPLILKAGMILFYLSLVLTVYSGVEYVIQNIDVFRR